MKHIQTKEKGDKVPDLMILPFIENAAPCDTSCIQLMAVTHEECRPAVGQESLPAAPKCKRNSSATEIAPA